MTANGKFMVGATPCIPNESYCDWDLFDDVCLASV